ncbi:hypothetical protein GCM10014715_19160 [Streptomyces spiralis]|uniref:Uncharacterized protein n=1 Tax=Streptomyces spiralis TaxID=66376 RepID=A0A918ZS32_9ACTN|nr:hypothetical protein [Streptomyces spiralis]GHE65675.1 hypothetical protein GCM10014715_19160 [Streptomyces spiralis]
MAHAAPVPARTTTPATRQPRTPDFFSHRAHNIGRWAGPFAIGLVYGYWAAANRRSGGPITTGNLVFGFVTVIVFTVLMAGVLYLAPRLRRELHAFVWFLFSAAAFGFLYNQSGESVLLTVGLSLAFGVLVGLFCFYWFYTHEDAQGHRVH